MKGRAFDEPERNSAKRAKTDRHESAGKSFSEHKIKMIIPYGKEASLRGLALYSEQLDAASKIHDSLEMTTFTA